MWLFICTSRSCLAAFRAIGEVGEAESLLSETQWPTGYKCPSCGQPLLRGEEQEIDPATLAALEIRTLEVQELFRALSGVGLPEERQCSLKEVQELLREQPIRKVTGHDIRGSEHCCLEWLELWDGTKVYFAASSHGAIIYRIVRPTKFTERVLKEVANV